jgi:peptide/nickel transport system substrate-binding protein
LPWFDDTPCDRAFWTADVIRAAAASRGVAGVAAIAEGYIAVHLRVARLGSGPFRLVREEPASLFEFEAYERYHHGRPALDRVHVRVLPDESQAIAELRRGAVDMLIPMAFDPGVDAVRYSALRDEPRVTIAEFPEPGYVALMFNVRRGRLFEAVELRQALRLCLDKPALVDAATNGMGVSLEGPLLPVHWAYQPDLVAPERDVDAARTLIESVGWAAGDDGVYERDGRRLAADIWVRADREDRVHFIELVAERARDCGIDLRPGLAEFDDLGRMVGLEPHVPPGREEPFDIYFGGWSTAFEPQDSFDVFHSDNIPLGRGGEPLNFIGYRNEHFDTLFEQAGVTYDQRERARLYRELQTILADDQPYIFAWAFWMRAYFTSDLVSESGPLNLSSPLWNWEVEKLRLRR